MRQRATVALDGMFSQPIQGQRTTFPGVSQFSRVR